MSSKDAVVRVLRRHYISRKVAEQIADELAVEMDVEYDKMVQSLVCGYQLPAQEGKDEHVKS